MTLLIQQLDGQLLGWFHAVRSLPLDFLFGLITWLGSLWVLGPLSAGVLAWQGRRALLLPLALLLSALSAQLLKAAGGRQRPDLYEALIALPSEPSLPSSHAAQAMACALAACWLAPIHLRWRLAAGLVPLALAVASSRLYLQVHWPSDVLAGLLLGGVVAAGVRRWLR